MKKIHLSDHFTYAKLLRFVLPSIIMMLCTSCYSIIDGFFVSNYAGKTAFAAVNLIMPIAMGGAALGFLIGTGGSAIVSKTLGEGKAEKANQYFTMLVSCAVIGGLTISVLGFILLPPIARALGAEGLLLQNSILYGRILCISLTGFILQNIFQSFFVVAEKPSLSLKISIAAGVTNIVFDYLFVAKLHMGISGAAIATAMGELLGGILPLIYFSRHVSKGSKVRAFFKNDSLLHFTRFHFEKAVLWKTCTNGSSELMTSISSSIVNILYNFQLMRLAGEDGIAAYGVIMYANFVFAAIFIGYSIGSAPLIGYNYGAGTHSELKNLFRKSLRLIGAAGMVLTLLAETLAVPLIRTFVGYDLELFTMTCEGFRLYALFFLFCGFNIWGSSFFTALSNGGISALISFLRTLIFQVSMVLLLPVFLGIRGIWLAVVAAELFALLVTGGFFWGMRRRYHYG